MINDLLGELIDIHGGGRDLLYPHHENEIAQCTAARCKCGDGESGGGGSEDGGGLARYWIHNGFVRVGSDKMSKSLGNFLTIR